MTAPGGTIEDAVQSLRSGGVLLLATDTLPGLHCRADDAVAMARIAAIKGRPDGKTLLVLAGDLAQAQQLTGPLTTEQVAACVQCWPGPFSLILPAGPQVDPAVTGGGKTVAIRIPAVPELRALILAVGVPLVSTSANRAGQAPGETMAGVDPVISGAVDGIWGVDPVGNGSVVPSALVDLTAVPFCVLRPGPMPFAGGPTADSSGS